MLGHLIKLARPVHWVKNGVLLAPLIFAGVANHVDLVEAIVMAIVSFCLLSSGVYTLNDLIDRESDRNHPLKKNRPLASGAVPVSAAVVFLILLFGGGLVLAWLVNLNFLIAAGVFVGLNLLYSLVLKNIVILDVMGVALSFVIRAGAGAVAIAVPASKWLLINTLFLALFLAFGKRRHELLLLDDNAESHRKSLGNYTPYLLDQCMGVTTAAVVVMYMLYTFSDEVSERLGTDLLYLTIPFVVYGIFRYLFLIHRRSEGGSPTRLLITDLPILLTVILWLATTLAILYF